MVMEADPIPNDASCVLLGLEPVAKNALILEVSDYPLDHPVLLRASRRDDILLQPITFD